MTPSKQLTDLLTAWSEGDDHALETLTPSATLSGTGWLPRLKEIDAWPRLGSVKRFGIRIDPWPT